jgi:hypothetical protein
MACHRYHHNVNRRLSLLRALAGPKRPDDMTKRTAFLASLSCCPGAAVPSGADPVLVLVSAGGKT